MMDENKILIKKLFFFFFFVFYNIKKKKKKEKKIFFFFFFFYTQKHTLFSLSRKSFVFSFEYDGPEMSPSLHNVVWWSYNWHWGRLIRRELLKVYFYINTENLFHNLRPTHTISNSRVPKSELSHEEYSCWSKNANRMLTALLWASNSSTLASCITAPPTFLKPSGVRFEEVICFTYDPRLTPEYCFAYPYVAFNLLASDPQN